SLAQRRSLPRSSCRWPRRGPPRSPLCPTRRSSDLDTARALGMRTDLMRGLVAVLVVLLAGAAVAAAGPIGFVGLAVPHLVRVLTDRKSTRLNSSHVKSSYAAFCPKNKTDDARWAAV